MSTPISQIVDEMFITTPDLPPILKPRAPDDEFRYFVFPKGIIGFARGQSDALADVFLKFGVLEVNRPTSQT